MNTQQIVQELTAERDRLQRAIDALTENVVEVVARPPAEAVNRVSRVVTRRGNEKPAEQVKPRVGSDGKKLCPTHPTAPRYKNGQCRECALEYQRRHDQEKKRQQAVPTAMSTAASTKKRALPCAHGCGKEFTNDIWLQKHEEDCAHVVRPNGSASVPRHTN